MLVYTGLRGLPSCWSSLVVTHKETVGLVRRSRNQGPECAKTPTSADMQTNKLLKIFSIFSGRVVEDRNRHRVTRPLGRIYLWKDWNTHTVVDVSSTQVLTFPSLPSTFTLTLVTLGSLLSSGSSFFFPSRKKSSGKVKIPPGVSPETPFAISSQRM